MCSFLGEHLSEIKFTTHCEMKGDFKKATSFNFYIRIVQYGIFLKTHSVGLGTDPPKPQPSNFFCLPVTEKLNKSPKTDKKP